MLLTFWAYCKYGKWQEAIDHLDRGGEIVEDTGLPVILVLLKYNADCDQCRVLWRRLITMPNLTLYDRHGVSALEYAVLQKHDVFVQETVGRFSAADITCAFLRAAHEKRTSMVSYFAARGADVDARFFHDGLTALHMAVCYNDIDFIRVVLTCRANVNVKTESGQTTLLLCIYRKNPSALRLLLDHGADVNQSNGGGIAPIHLAILENNLEAVDILLERGADVKKATTGGFTPMHYAVITKNTALVDLFSNASSINATTTSLRTPLDHCLAKSPFVDRAFVGAMRSRGANFSLALFCSHCEYNRVELGDIVFLLRLARADNWQRYLNADLRREWTDWCNEFTRTRRAFALFNKRHALLLPSDVRGAVASFLREPPSVQEALQEAALYSIKNKSGFLMNISE